MICHHIQGLHRVEISWLGSIDDVELTDVLPANTDYAHIAWCPGDFVSIGISGKNALI